ISFSIGNGPDWIKGLTIEVKNVSENPVYFFHYAALLHSNQKATALHIPFKYNDSQMREAFLNKTDISKSNAKPLLPGQTVKLTISENDYKGVMYWVDNEPSSYIERIVFLLQFAEYGDGATWSGGNNYPKKANKEINLMENK